MSSIFDVEEDHFQKSIRFSERGSQLKEKKEFKAALEAYSKSLSYLESVCVFTDSIEKQGLRSSYKFEERQFKYTIFLGMITTEILGCFVSLEDYEKALKFNEKSQKVIDSLANHSTIKYSRAEPQDQNTYELMRERCAYYGQMASLGQAVRERKIINEGEGIAKDFSELDEIFERMCAFFEQCCSHESCLVPGQITKSDGCFIATAAYSTSTHPDLDTFRNFRDEKLLTNPVGKQLVNLYYQISPSIAQYMENHPGIKSIVRQKLEMLANWMRN